MHTLTLSDKTLNRLRQAAALRGMDTNAYAEELLEISLAVLKESSATAFGKRHRAMEFSAVASSGRTASEIDADIEASRAEWDTEIPTSGEEKTAS